MNYLSKRHKIAKKKQHAGVFMPLPEDLAKKFNPLGKHDNSVPHVTVLYIGEVPKDKHELLKTIVTGVISDWEPFELKLDDKVTYFNNEENKVAKLKVISKDIYKLNKKLKEILSDAGFKIDNTHPNYSPHITLKYIENPEEKYEDDFPQGSWTSEYVEVWSCGKPKNIAFGKKLSKRMGKFNSNKKEVT
jgi:2'-5' RNA ligase